MRVTIYGLNRAKECQHGIIGLKGEGVRGSRSLLLSKSLSP